jgi:hypothetical protein
MDVWYCMGHKKLIIRFPPRFVKKWLVYNNFRLFNPIHSIFKNSWKTYLEMWGSGSLWHSSETTTLKIKFSFK